MPLFTGFYTSEVVVWDLSHQQDHSGVCYVFWASASVLRTAPFSSK